MRIKKTLSYELTEETLEKDIDVFIDSARQGEFSWDHKYDREGLKIIKAYFRMIQEKFKDNEFEECKRCYDKLILFLFDASRGDDEADFGYEDLLGSVNDDFDKFIRSYFICLVKTCNSEELAEYVSHYASKLKEYGFESDKRVLLEHLSKNDLNILEERLLAKTTGMTRKDEDKQEIVYFILHLVEMEKDKSRYILLCDRFKGILPEEELKYLKEEYDA